MTVLPELSSAPSSVRLEQIAALRAKGLGAHVDLPQLVVCGDQSAGKSSVLEGLTGIPFPRQDGVCTKFATEIILQHADHAIEITASVLPSPSRTEPPLSVLRSYRVRLEDFQRLPSVISEVGALMGLRGFGGIQEGPAFSEDILRIEVSGRCGMHLSIVDLPGLISVANEEQTETDVVVVTNMVESYIANPRTIILAIVQAGNDIANQPIIQKSRLVDRPGRRTVGIITKADLINEGSERRVALLAKNLDTTKLKLGYFILRNPTPMEMEQGISMEERMQRESSFFRSSPWEEQCLDQDRVGIIPLKRFLQTLLEHHIEGEMPKVREDIRGLLDTTRRKLLAFGEERQTLAHMRLYLTRVAMRFTSLVVSALNGTYQDTERNFFRIQDQGSSARLRNTIHELNSSFAEQMRKQGARRSIAAHGPESSQCNDFADHMSIGSDEELSDQLIVTEAEMKRWIRSVYAVNRRKELPGSYNNVLLWELFRIQSSRWHRLAQSHVETVGEKIVAFVDGCLRHVVHDEHTLTEIRTLTTATLLQNMRESREQLVKLQEDEILQQPITYNHYYTDNMQKSRQGLARDQLRKAMDDARTHDWNGKFHFTNNPSDEERLLSSLQRRVIVDMDEQACSEAFAALQAYYKVARKTYVDNICRQVIERSLLRHLPKVFSPERVATLSDVDLMKIAAESSAMTAERHALQELQMQLATSLEDLRN